MENLRILENKEHNGIELYFNSKPEARTIEGLKAHHFRWHGVKKCWFAKSTKENQEYCQLLQFGKITQPVTATTELLTLRPATEDEKIEIVKADWKDEKMQAWLLKNYDYYITSDNHALEIEKPSKLSINKTIWYDDELPDDEAPKVNLQNFLYYNEKNCNHYDCYAEQHDRQHKFYLCEGNSRKLAYIDYDSHFGNWDTPKNAIRELTEEEIKDILTIYKKQKDDYTERLKRYYNRYSNQIYACGYWVNR